MATADIDNRNRKAAEHLQVLRSLAGELAKAMDAISHNALSDFEESVANQAALSAQLCHLAEDLSASTGSSPAAPESVVGDEFMQEITAANNTLQILNRRYSALLKLSSHSAALMISFFSSFKGQFQEGSGPRLKHQTWSCQV